MNCEDCLSFYFEYDAKNRVLKKVPFDDHLSYEYVMSKFFFLLTKFLAFSVMSLKMNKLRKKTSKIPKLPRKKYWILKICEELFWKKKTRRKVYAKIQRLLTHDLFLINFKHRFKETDYIHRIRNSKTDF